MVMAVGLTGGIGSGKSTVADLFKQFSIDVIDTDLIAREVVAPPSKALDKIVARFGPSILNQDKSLNRRALAKQMFQHDNDKVFIDNLLHPLIRQRMRQAILASHTAYCIVVVPLLTENKLQHLFKRVLVVDCEDSLQDIRIAQRDQRSANEIQHIKSHQATREQRLIIADDVIENNGDISHLAQQVAKLHQHYLQIASANT